jgi:hypothetical protein
LGLRSRLHWHCSPLLLLLLLSTGICIYELFWFTHYVTLRYHNFHVQNYDNLAILDGIADVLEQLNHGAFLELAGLDAWIELRSEHGLLHVGAIGKHHSVSLLHRLSGGDLPDVQNLHEGAKIDVPVIQSHYCIGRQLRRH